MSNNIVYAGELNTLVEILKTSVSKNATSENVRLAVSLGKKFVRRIDSLANEENDGRLIPFSSIKYIMRYEPDMLKNGTLYHIRDQDGDYDVVSVALFGTARNKFLEIKCEKRG